MCILEQLQSKSWNDVSIPLEKAIENLEHVKAVYSNSYSNMSSIQVEYEYGIDMDEAKRALESALDAVTSAGRSTRTNDYGN